MESAIYEGTVWHRRRAPAEHAFRYRLFMMYLDLDELPSLFDPYWLWSSSRPNVAWFRRRDHLGPADRPLKASVYDLVQEHTGLALDGPVRLLTHLCYFGHRFNPVSLYYCYDSAGAGLRAIVAEVNNTPWHEQYCYVVTVPPETGAGDTMRFEVEKAFHVSPFMGMNQSYQWRLSAPGPHLTVSMASSEQGQQLFDASMSLRRCAIGHRSLACLLVQYPLLTMKVTVAIHYQALWLWLKRCPYYPHPRGASTPRQP